MDGTLDDDVWKLALPVDEFTQRNPQEGQPASERSEIRVVYDNDALYFGCMYYDLEPGKIVSRLTRRDNEIESDRASIRIDSYHDHQTGYEFTFNVAGVKIDILQYDDGNKEDDSWDPVWDVQTRITPEGWSAEVKIPFHALRYRSFEDSSEIPWGINMLRYISRKQEDDRWAFTPKSESGFISHFGHLTGLQNLPTPRLLELLPFAINRKSYHPATSIEARREEFQANAGIDVKYGLSTNFTLDATVNPDFGQVEADPAVLNLSTFETFYPERRPFFVEGTQIIRFTTFGGEFGPGMFYSRRIGRALGRSEANVATGGQLLDIPQQVTILGAVKLTGKTNDGLSIGVLQAFTEEERATSSDSVGTRTEEILEPFAHYGIVRLKQDLLGNSSIGMIATSTSKRGRSPALTAGSDWNIKLENNTYSLNGFLALSDRRTMSDERVTGSAGKLNFEKIAGEHWLWSLGTDFTSKKYNINDVGFFFRPDDYGGVISVTYKEDVPSTGVREFSVGVFKHLRQNFDGVNLNRDSRVSGSVLFSNYWRSTASIGVDLGAFDDRETRGNGLYRKSTEYSTSVYLFSDRRNSVVGKIGERFGWNELGKHGWAMELGVIVKPLPWMEWEVEGEYERVRRQESWVDNVSNDAIFADRNTDRYTIIVRSTITFTRDLTLELYAQQFSATGYYENFRTLLGAASFSPVSYTGSPDFDRQAFNSNLVLRWEYLPGSTLFLVWSQAREGERGMYNASFGDNVAKTFLLPPANVLLLKASYWWSL